MPEGVSRGTGAARREALRVRSAALKQRAANDADRIGIHGMPVLHWRIEGGTPTLDSGRAAQPA
jgi:hypothetical protein